MRGPKLGTFGRSVLILGSGTAFAQGANILIAPILSRVYTPAEIGIFGTIQNLLAFAVVFATLRYDQAVPVPKEASERRAVAYLGMAILPITVTIVSLICLLTYPFLKAKHADLAVFLWTIPAAMLPIGAYNCLSLWGVAEGRIKIVAKSKMAQSITMSLLQVGGGFLKWGPLALIGGNALGQASGLRVLAQEFVASGPMRIPVSQLKELAARYKAFPLINSWSSLINTAGMAVPQLVLFSAFGATVAGYYAFALKLFAVPSAVVIQSVSPLYIAECARLRHDAPHALPNRMGGVLKKIAPLFLLILPLLFFLPAIFAFVFGNNFRMAGVFAIPLAITTLLSLAANTTNVLLVLGRNLWQSLWEIFRLVAMAVVIALALFYKTDSVTTVVAISVTLSVFYALLVVLNWLAVKSAAHLPPTPEPL